MRLDVRTFRMGTEKEAALKPLEEASEVRAAWQIYDEWAKVRPGHLRGIKANDLDSINDHNRSRLGSEIADCVQACCNLAERNGIDLEDELRKCEQRNRERGRYE